jgi:hypothetical protein
MRMCLYVCIHAAEATKGSKLYRRLAVHHRSRSVCSPGVRHKDAPDGVLKRSTGRTWASEIPSSKDCRRYVHSPGGFIIAPCRLILLAELAVLIELPDGAGENAPGS